MPENPDAAPAAVVVPRHEATASKPSQHGTGRRWAAGAALVVLGALALRLWGIKWGLPFAYNLDERSHFVPRAVGFFRDGSLDPDYQLNPSGIIEWIAAVLFVRHGGSSDAVVRTWQSDPGAVWMTARVACAVLSAAAAGLLYLAGRRLFDRTTGLVAAAILATAFLPVYYGHLALNDAPSLAPSALALLGIAGVLRGGRVRDYVIAGLGIGLAAGLKYNAGFLVLPLLAAATAHAAGWSGLSAAWRRALVGLVLAGVAVLVGFALCDPYALVRPRFFLDQLDRLSAYTKGGLLLGETERSGYRYYAWTLLWGFGVVPLLLAFAGAVRLIARDRVRAALLVPAVLLFLLFVGSQGRYFARYAMPVYPLLALLAGVGAAWAGREAAGRLAAVRRLAPVLAPAAVALVCLQGLVTSVHGDSVLARDDTRSTTREWMVHNIPARTSISVEPLVPKEWYADGARLPNPKSRRGYRWTRFVRTGADSRRLAKQFRGAGRPADFANYGFTLFPGLIDEFRSRGVCWLVSGSMQSGRVFNNPRRAPQGIRYYRALPREADLRYQLRPFPGPEADNFFQYDFSVNFAPLRFELPGPAIRVYRLRDCTPKISRPKR